MKKTIYLGILFLLVIFTAIVFVILIIMRSSSPKEIIEEIPLPTKSPIRFDIPEGEKIEISGIPIKNPYISPVETNTTGDSLMTRDKGYDLVYIRESSQFIITIMMTPFETYRQIAEQALLNRLEISADEACLLDVSIGTPQGVNPDEAGRRHGLSFCK